VTYGGKDDTVLIFWHDSRSSIKGRGTLDETTSSYRALERNERLCDEVRGGVEVRKVQRRSLLKSRKKKKDEQQLPSSDGQDCSVPRQSPRGKADTASAWVGKDTHSLGLVGEKWIGNHGNRSIRP
jgi:hypothetical protein